MAIKRQEILTNIVTRFQGITGAPTYYTTVASGSVKLWPSSPFEEADLPAIVVRDIADEITFEDVAGANNRHAHRLTVEIDIIAVKGSDPIDTTVRQMIADVYKAVNVDDTWSGKAITTEAGGDEFLIDQAERQVGGATITIVVLYITNRFSES